MTLSVSIVMPVYNMERHVGRALEALLALRVPDGLRVSLTVVDDASPDASMEVAGALLRDAPFPVQVLRHPVNLGRAMARNTGLASAAGDFVWFVDGDDPVPPGQLEAFAPAATQDVDIVVADATGAAWSAGTGGVWAGPEAVEQFLFQRIRAHLSSKLIRRTLFDGLEFPPGRPHEDVAICARLLRRARAVAFVTVPGSPVPAPRGPRPAVAGSPRVLDLYTGVLDACAVLAAEPGRASTAGLLHFRLRAGAMSVVEAAARARAGASVVQIVRRDLRLADVAAAARHRLWAVAAGVLLILAVPGWYARLHRLRR
ncbi:glycosyltransferase family 2 protein [Dactylosporangium sp. CA-139066]|uniref:glycosyltransferase family 2 protein n=1 Tax=Dactylosporangium sp. CA-139066 TaxID=3239930 RepID=UPI003D94AD09